MNRDVIISIPFEPQRLSSYVYKLLIFIPKPDLPFQNPEEILFFLFLLTLDQNAYAMI